MTKQLEYRRTVTVDKFEKGAMNTLRSAVTAGAMAAVHGLGQEEPNLMDALAMGPMEEVLNDELDTEAVVVCGEGAMDEAPYFPQGYTFGQAVPGMPRLQLVIDPVDGSSSAAKGGEGALVTAAGALEGEGTLFSMPECYGLKLGIGRELSEARKKTSPDEKYDSGEFGTFYPARPWLRQPIGAAVRYASEVLGKKVVVEMLDRPARHAAMVEEIRRAGGELRLIPHGDIASMLRVMSPKHNVDIAYGIGGGPEGIIAASIAAVGRGHFEQMHWVNDDPERLQKLIDAGINPNHLLSSDGTGDDWLVKGNVFFALAVLTRVDDYPGTTFAQDSNIKCFTIYGRSRTNTFYVLESDHLEPPPVPKLMRQRG